MRKLRRGLLYSVGIATVALTCIYANQAKSDAPANHAADLLDRIASLEDRVAELERRLLNRGLFQSQLSMTTIPSPIIGQPTAPAPLQTPPGIPPGSIPYQFNGGTYYIVPLTEEASR